MKHGFSAAHAAKANVGRRTSSESMPLLLIVEDDPLMADTLQYILQKHFRLRRADTRASCVALVRGMSEQPALALVDLGLPPDIHQPTEGFAVIGDLLQLCPEIKIVVLTGQDAARHARQARALGAVDFIEKPVTAQNLLQRLRSVVPFGQQQQTERHALIGHSPVLVRLREDIAQFAMSPFPLLIEGESGTGKEVIATALHDQGPRVGKPFLAFNCAAVPAELAESILFGHSRGAFTGATENRIGYFESAEDGTLFLDEIGDLPLSLQPKLLRVLENGEYRHVGEAQLRHARCRVLAATNRHLQEEVRQGRFRGDLYHRLTVTLLKAPSLREMGRDRLELLDHFRTIYARQARCDPFHLSPEAEAEWLAYDFPGNARQLRNIVIRLLIKYPGALIAVPQLQEEFDTLPSKDLAPSMPSPTQGAAPIDVQEIALAHLSRLDEDEALMLDDILARWERAYIDAAMSLSHHNTSRAARKLGINRTTLSYRRTKNHS